MKINHQVVLNFFLSLFGGSAGWLRQQGPGAYAANVCMICTVNLISVALMAIGNMYEYVSGCIQMYMLQGDTFSYRLRV